MPAGSGSGAATLSSEFSVNTVAMATATSSLFALMTGAIAAIALPPQIAVPAEIKMDVLRFISSRRPIQ